MAQSLPMFSKLPQDIQDRIWERSLTPSPCVQRLEMYQCPLKHYVKALDQQGSKLPDILKEAMFNANELVTFVLPSEDLAKPSPYYSNVQVARTCQAARNVHDKLTTRQANEEKAEEEMLARLNSDTSPKEWVWKIDKDKTITTIPALQMVPVYEGKRRSSMIAAVGSCFVPLNLTSDVLCVDLKWVDGLNSPYDLIKLWKYGRYSRYLLPLRQLAVEFSSARFKKHCKRCKELIQVQSEYETWKLATADHKTKGPCCLLCNSLSSPDLADLTTAQKKEARHWLRTARIHNLVSKVDSGALTLAIAAQRFSPGPEWDMAAFSDVFPLLQRVFTVMENLRLQHSKPLGDDSSCMAYACVDDFDGDALALWNYSRALDHFSESRMYIYDQFFYQAKNYDVAGHPICLARRDDGEHEVKRHKHQWCKDSRTAANFFPLTTPQLQTMYVIDRRIKLRAGASIPPGARTFRGIFCLYVEVQPDQHEIWEYPEAEPWGATVFNFARHLRENMSKNQARIHEEDALWGGHAHLFPIVRSAARDDPSSPHRRAMDGDTVPECKVLAVVELKGRG